MADQNIHNRKSSGIRSSHGFEKAAEKVTTATKNLADQALSAGRDIKDKAVGLVGAILRHNQGYRLQISLILPRMLRLRQPTS